VTKKNRGRTRRRAKSSLNERDLDEISKRYQQGDSSSAIAEALGITDYDVLAILRERGGTVRSKDGRSKPAFGKSFLDLHPVESQLWHQQLNNGSTPAEVKPGSSKRFWWQCKENPDHIWQQSVWVVAKGHGCPFCSGNRFSRDLSLTARYPHIADLFDEDKNGLRADQVTANSTNSYWWHGDCGHQWESTPNRMVTANKRSQTILEIPTDGRVITRGCPFCAGKAVWPSESFADLFPAQAEHWHPHRNGKLTPTEVSPFSMTRVWWQCSKHRSHEWKGSIASKTRSAGCPYCQNRRLDPKTNSLSVTHPMLAKQWHPTKNRGLTPRDVTSGYSKQIWWKCAKGSDHIWKQKPVIRTRGFGCPFCGGVRLSRTNSLAAENLKLANQWIRSRNKPLRPEAVRQNDKRYVWWQCPVDARHKYRARIAARYAGADCPFCTLAPRSKAEIYLEFELRQFFDIAPDKSVIRIGERNLRCDIILDNHNVVIEFDGSYWHKELRARDEEKTRLLSEAGWKVIRVREEPLTATSPLDVVVPPQSLKKTTDAVIRRLLQIGVEPLANPARYLRTRSSSNKNAADKYIAQRLKKRAARRARESRAKKS